MKLFKLISLLLLVSLLSSCKSSEKETPVTDKKTEVVAKTETVAKKADHGIVTKESFVDVKTTMDRLEKIISKKEGINLFNRINHAENFRKTGAKDVADSELIIFGNPKVGLKMLSKDPKSGLDLPLKILAYQAKDGKVYISYRAVSFYNQIYDLENCEAQAKMDKSLTKISDIIIKSPKDFKAFIKKAKAAKK